MKSIKKFFEQKKFVFGIIVAVLSYLSQNFGGFEIPTEIWTMLGGYLAITYKAGVNRTENATKELLESTNKLIEAIKESKNK